MKNEIISLIIEKTNKVPKIKNVKEGKSALSHVSRALDIALLSNKFKLDPQLFHYISCLHLEEATALSRIIIDVVKKKMGSHVLHNVYFRDFPNNVPSTKDFWMACIKDALESGAPIEVVGNSINLLSLPIYGKYLHSYEEMVAAHEQFIPSLAPHYTILTLGSSYEVELQNLFLTLAGSPIPLHEKERESLLLLAREYKGENLPHIPVRENLALINRVRYESFLSLYFFSPLDILRMLGDETLETKKKFPQISRPNRRMLMSHFNSILTYHPQGMNDLSNHFGEFKRLGEKIHPHEYSEFPLAQTFFQAARNEEIPNKKENYEELWKSGKIQEALKILCDSYPPGVFLRNLGRACTDISSMSNNKRKQLETYVKTILPYTLRKTSTKLLLSLWEYFLNYGKNKEKRIFINRKGSAWVTPDKRNIKSSSFIQEIIFLIGNELQKRMCKNPINVHIPLSYAVPLSKKTTEEGMLPRGSTFELRGNILRFFVYWKEKNLRTDWDLSCLLLDKHFSCVEYCSWTSLSGTYYTHSGDLTSSEKGASEFIDISLDKLPSSVTYIIPQINIFAGESFSQVREGFMGFMSLNEQDKGLPFEPLAVESKFALSGEKKVALPFIFTKNSAKSTNVYLKGISSCNRVESNKLTTSLLLSTIYERQFLTVGDVLTLQKEINEQLPIITIEKPEDVYLTLRE